MNEPNNIKWISSDGGPYVLASVSSASNWRGQYGSCIRVERDGTTDYDRACQITDHVGIISGTPHDVLVISEPDQLAWMSDDCGGGVIVKWIGAESDEQVLSGLRSVDLNEFDLSKIHFEVNESPLHLFDAANDFSSGKCDFLQIEISPGIYSVSTKNFEPSSDLWLFLIRLSKKQ